MIVFIITDLSLHGQLMSNNGLCNLVDDCHGNKIVSIEQLNYMLDTWPELEYTPIEHCPPCVDEDTGGIIPCE